MPASAQFFKDEKYVADVQCDATLQVVVEVDVTTQRLPVAVECAADELPFSVDDGASGVTSGDVVGCQEADRHCAVRHGVAAEIFIENEFFQLGRNYEFPVFRVLFFENTVCGGVVVVVYGITRAV